MIPKTLVRTSGVIIVAGIISAVLGSIVLLILYYGARQAFINEFAEVTEASRYTDILERNWHHSGLTQQFPTSIPSNATDVHFSYIPGLAQGGSRIKLRLGLPPEQIAKALTEYRAKAIHQFHSGERKAPTNSPEDVPVGAFPDTFEILVLIAEPLGHPELIWNHGVSSGVAIDNQNSEIVYWASEW